MSDRPDRPERPAFSNREPIFWTGVTPGFNDIDRMKATTLPNGRTVVERVPQGAHDGASPYDNPVRLPSNRAPVVLKDDGNEVPIVLTTAAAHTDINTGYANQQRRKARAFGWFDVGACPVHLVLSRELLPQCVKERSIFDPVTGDLAARPCSPGTYGPSQPCSHYVAERAARRRLHAEIQRERQSGYIQETDKLLQAVSQLVEMQRMQTQQAASAASPQTITIQGDDFGSETPHRRQRRALDAIAKARGDKEPDEQ